MDGVRALVREMAAESIKPPTVKTVEKIVEKVVEVEATAAHLKPTHMPKVQADITLKGVTLPQYDAPDAPGVDKLYRWQPTLKSRSARSSVNSRSF